MDSECSEFSTQIDRYDPNSEEINKISLVPIYLPIPSNSSKLPPTFIRAGFAGMNTIVSVETESLLGEISCKLWVVGACSFYFTQQGNMTVPEVAERYRGVWGLSAGLNSVETYSPLPFNARLRANATCQSFGSRIYIIGGVYLDTLEPTDAVDALDVATLQYFPRVLQHVEPVMNAAVAIDSSMMYVAGGVTSSCANSSGISTLCNSFRVTGYLIPQNYWLNQSLPLVPVVFPSVSPYMDVREIGRHLPRIFSFGGRLLLTAGPRLVEEYIASPAAHDKGIWVMNFTAGNPTIDSTVYAFPLPDLFIGTTLTFYTFGGLDPLSQLPTGGVFMRFGSDSIPRVIGSVDNAPVDIRLNFTLQPSPTVGYGRLSNNVDCYGSIVGIADEKLIKKGEKAEVSFFPVVLSPLVFVCFSHGESYLRSINTSVRFFTVITALSPFALVSEVPFPTPSPTTPTSNVFKDAVIGAGCAILLIASATVIVLKWRRRLEDESLRERLNSAMSLGVDANDSLVRNTTSDSRYKVIRRVGEGAFSSVYLVRRKTDNAEFAMKFMICWDDRERLEAIKECETINSLQGHPNVIQLIDMFMNYEFSHTNRDSSLSENDTSLLLSNSMRAVFKPQGSKLERKQTPTKESPFAAHGTVQYGGTTSGFGGRPAASSPTPQQPLSSGKDAPESSPNVHTRYLCLVMEYHVCGDLSRYVLRQSSLLNHSGQSRSSNETEVAPAGGSVHSFPHTIPEYQLLSVAYQIASVLHHLHTQRPPIVHRDLKPENVLIRGSTPPTWEDPVIPIVVTDFGLAFIQEEHRKSGKGGGTRPYISPESWRGQTTTASDIWSFGCVMYALATERLTADTVRIMFVDARSASFNQMIQSDLLACHYSQQYAEFVTSLLEVDPKKRPTAERLLKLFKASAANGRVVFADEGSSSSS